MPALSTTHTLQDYPKLAISRYRDTLKADPKAVTALTLDIPTEPNNTAMMCN